ncbi:MAG: transcription termination/antitermination protein NusG [Acidimicrobiia bacterium]|nr:transcription termination/antitermination protein NusG [Acidimicrobiia bacterium]
MTDTAFGGAASDLAAAARRALGGSDEAAVAVAEDEAAVEEETAVEEQATVAADEAASADEADEATEDETTPEASGESEEEEEAAPAAPVDLTPASPYDLPGGWYVVHSYSGYENKVKANLETRIKSMHMEGLIFDVVIPMEEVVEFKAGRKVNVMRKKFPGYILVRMYLDDDSWYTVRNTPGVTGFVGSANKPSPLSRREVERILGVRRDDEEPKKAPRFKPEWEVGETVRVVEGPFADFNGLIEDINVDQSKVRVLVDIFGRETPVELNFDQIQKY